MKTTSPIKIFTPRGQVVAVLLYVLSTERADRTKQTVVAFIRGLKLLALIEEDEKPYPSSFENGNFEARWITLVAWARKDCVERGWMRDDLGRDRWRITNSGKDVWESLVEKCATGTIDVGYGYLWTTKFKKKLNPSRDASATDQARPKYSIYDDLRAEQWHAGFELELDRIMKSKGNESPPET